MEILIKGYAKNHLYGCFAQILIDVPPSKYDFWILNVI